MKAKDLIEKLKQFNPDTEVYVGWKDSDYYDIEGFTTELGVEEKESRILGIEINL